MAATVIRYKQATRPNKKVILDELVASTGYNRKYLLGLLRHPPPSGKRARQRKRTRKRIYTPEVHKPLVRLWEVSGRLCGKRLVPGLPDLLDALERHGELSVQPGVRPLLLGISPATADRLLQSERARYQQRGIATTKPGTLLKHQIPIRTFADWDESGPGFLEADLVAHCGESTHGEYVHSLTLTDVATGWTECVALLNRSQHVVQEAIEQVRRRLPFALLGIDSDNGSEFINATLLRYCQQQKITFTRSRPYKKNDQCHVEQKNWCVVRHYIGYERYEGAQAVRAMTRLYQPLLAHLNYFQPSLKLTGKHRDGAKLTKTYDRAQTPYRRLLAWGILGPAQQQALLQQWEPLNPAELLRQVRRAQEQLWPLAHPHTHDNDGPDDQAPTEA